MSWVDRDADAAEDGADELRVLSVSGGAKRLRSAGSVWARITARA
jgi:hypothetical protein